MRLLSNAVVRLSISAIFAFVPANPSAKEWANARHRASDQDWDWVRVAPQSYPGRASWQVLQGVAQLKFKGPSFVAQLDHIDQTYSFRYLLKGTLHGDKVNATEVQLNTDAAPMTYQGRTGRSSGSSESWISLQSGQFQIGLRTRPDPADPPAVNTPDGGYSSVQFLAPARIDARRRKGAQPASSIYSDLCRDLQSGDISGHQVILSDFKSKPKVTFFWTEGQIMEPLQASLVYLQGKSLKFVVRGPQGEARFAGGISRDKLEGEMRDFWERYASPVSLHQLDRISSDPPPCPPR